MRVSLRVDLVSSLVLSSASSSETLRPTIGSGTRSLRLAAETVRPVRKRKLVEVMRKEWDISIRRACHTLKNRGQADLERRIK